MRATTTVAGPAIAAVAMAGTVRGSTATTAWLRYGGAILMLAIVTGCAGSSASPSGGPGGSTAPTTQASAPTLPLESLIAPSTYLATALEPLRAASAFETRVDVGGATVVTATGRSVGDASRMTVTTSGKSVEYIEIPPKAWAREPKGKWVLVAAEQAPGSPLDALATPLTLIADPKGGGPGSLVATYPAAALGLEGDPLTVQITIDGKTVTFRYAAATEGHDTSSTTTIGPASPDPITAPTS